jgi:hypothetical protein
MNTFNYIVMFLGAVFFTGMALSAFYWFKFFPALKDADSELYEKLRFRWHVFYNKDYANFIFRKGYESSPDAKVRYYGQRLYWYGNIGQWGFNLLIILILIMAIISFITNAN